MAEFPKGAALIPNPYNNIPGFGAAPVAFTSCRAFR
jgi:molybdopterin-biosynthesis enzyme MoeA-like protein